MSPVELAVIVLGQLVAAVGTVAVLKNEVKWLKQWCRDHEANDAGRFQQLQDEDERQEDINRQERHDVRTELDGVRGRVSLLEGRAGMVR